jgi:LCP family protein required for cell wall assembly
VNEEVLIREAIAAEANEAVDPGIVLAELRRARKPKRRRTMLVAVTGFAVAAAVAAVVVPLTTSREAGPAAGDTTSQVNPPPVAAGDQTILVLGLDVDKRTDAIMLVRVVDGSVRGVSLPRDTAIGGTGRLNSVFAQAYQAAEAAGKDPLATASTTTIEKVAEFTGVRAQHYAVIDMAGFGRLSEAVGGVEVCLAKPLDDTWSNVKFPAGKQIVTGDRALAFVRSRHGDPNGDLGRMARQQTFLRGLAAKLTSGDALRNPELARIVRENVRTDPQLDVLGLAQQLAGDPSVIMAIVPWATGPDAGTLTVDPARATSFTEKVFEGSDPLGSPGSPGTGTVC